MEAGAHWRRVEAQAIGRRDRMRWRRRLAALTLAALAQAGLLWLTAIQQHPNPFATAETPALPVWIVSPRVLARPRRSPRRSTSPQAARAATRERSPAPSTERPAPAVPAPGLPPASGSPAPGPSGVGAPAGVASALRGSLVGCANAEALRLSDAERAECRDRFAAGAAMTPHRWGIPGDKRAYYDTVLATEAKFRNDPGGGHGPGVLCIPGARGRPLPHAIKIGPCYIEPPQGMLDVDVDVPEVGSQRGSQPPPR